MFRERWINVKKSIKLVIESLHSLSSGFVERFETNSYPSLHTVTHQSWDVSTNSVFSVILSAIMNRVCWDTSRNIFAKHHPSKTSFQHSHVIARCCCRTRATIMSGLGSLLSWPCYFSTVKFVVDPLNINNTDHTCGTDITDSVLGQNILFIGQNIFVYCW